MARSNKKSFARLILGYVILSIIIILSSWETASAEPSYAGWFKHEAEVLKSWTITEVTGDPYQIKIHRNKSTPGNAQRRAFVFYPRPSSAYDTSISSILNVFEEKDIDIEFTVFNFKKDTERGKLGLFMASEWGADFIFPWDLNPQRGCGIPIEVETYRLYQCVRKTR